MAALLLSAPLGEARTLRSGPLDVSVSEGGIVNACRVYWGSHGCNLPRGHEGGHECACCDCPAGHHNGLEAPMLVDDDDCVCVARAPYYGSKTRFYGEDAQAQGLP